jgi:membrane protein DedA with SNARE-associated domain
VLKGLTPVPFKLVTIVSGMAHYPLLPFVVLCAVTRGARFFLIAALVRWQGEALREALEQRLELWSMIFLGVIMAGVTALVVFG